MFPLDLRLQKPLEWLSSVKPLKIAERNFHLEKEISFVDNPPTPLGLGCLIVQRLTENVRNFSLSFWGLICRDLRVGVVDHCRLMCWSGGRLQV